MLSIILSNYLHGYEQVKVEGSAEEAALERDLQLSPENSEGEEERNEEDILGKVWSCMAASVKGRT